MLDATTRSARTFRVATSDGLSLSAALHGPEDGKEIVLVHGLGQSRLSWIRQTGGTLAKNHRILSYDLRGHGDSARPDETARYSDPQHWADDLKAVIDAAGFRRPVIVGWSFGGLITGYFLRHHGAERIGGVNLVGAVTKLDPSLLGIAALHHAGPLGSEDLAERVAAYASFLKSCFATPPDPTDLEQMLVYNGMVPRAVQRAVVKLESEGLDLVWAELPELLLSWGDEEQHTRYEMSRRLLDLNPRARMSVYDGAGHAPFYERPARFNRELAEFTAGLQER
jgi:non-heme chloroperoxidase